MTVQQAFSALTLPNAILNKYLAFVWAHGSVHCYYDNFDNLPFLQSAFTRIEYTSGLVPQKGDIAVWKKSLNPGGCGNVAICTGEGNTEYFCSYD